MSLRRFAALDPAGSVRRIDFEECDVVGGFAGGYILIVRGEAPCLNMEVRLLPLIYIDCPEYWGIELVGILPGCVCLDTMKPFLLALPLDGLIGHAGIEAIGATRTKRFDLP